MKPNIIYFAIAFLCIAGASSCTKEIERPGSASLVIANGVASTGSYLYTNFNGVVKARPSDPTTTFTTNDAWWITYGSSTLFTSFIGATSLSLAPVNDTLNTIYAGTLDLAAGSTHTLFLTGTKAQPDYLYTTDQPLNIAPTDSSTGFRFVNIATGSLPVSVNIQGVTTNVVSNLAYKGASDFLKVPAGSAVSSYRFEFRDATSGTLLAASTQTINSVSGGVTNTIRGRNKTVALIRTAAGGYSVIAINYYK